MCLNSTCLYRLFKFCTIIDTKQAPDMHLSYWHRNKKISLGILNSWNMKDALKTSKIPNCSFRQKPDEGLIMWWIEISFFFFFKFTFYTLCIIAKAITVFLLCVFKPIMSNMWSQVKSRVWALFLFSSSLCISHNSGRLEITHFINTYDTSLVALFKLS